MNRIILIGNGFDLAHGMRTSYRDFIDDYWNTFTDSVEKYRIINADPQVYEDKHKCIKVEIVDISTIEDLKNNLIEFNCRWHGKIYGKIKYNNKFLEHICTYLGFQNWVDIENEYYKKLRKCNPDQIKILNREFKGIEELLEKYLIKVEQETEVDTSIIFSKIKDKIYSTIDLKDIPESFEKRILEDIIILAAKEKKAEPVFDEFKDKESFKKQLNDYHSSNQKQLTRERIPKLMIDYIKNKIDTKTINTQLIKPNSTLFLNFNYTHTHQQYISEKSDFQTIHIHGELNNSKNPIIFGYGDELAKDYKEIEEKNDNEYLKNVKSIRYLETDNYRRLLSFIESEPYQIFIMGHSCGNSDRTLLNTLFEHKNCVSIKPFFHKREDGSDNYSEIVQNISRNFTNKAIMRERVVNKMYCEPLS